jgi:hypothetical protein
MPRWNNRAIGGQPTRPYRDFEVNAGSDCWLELTFLDRNGALQVPATLSYRIDNLTDCVIVQGDTAVTAGLASSMELNIPASVNVMAYNWRGSQLNQVKVTATYADGSTETAVFVYELIGIATVG